MVRDAGNSSRQQTEKKFLDSFALLAIPEYFVGNTGILIVCRTAKLTFERTVTLPLGRYRLQEWKLRQQH